MTIFIPINPNKKISSISDFVIHILLFVIVLESLIYI